MENLFEHQIGWCVGHEDGPIVVYIEDVKVQCFQTASKYQKAWIFVDGLVIQGWTEDDVGVIASNVGSELCDGNSAGYLQLSSCSTWSSATNNFVQFFSFTIGIPL